MVIEQNHIRELMDKLENLSPERVAEVEDFIDFIKQRDLERQFTYAATRSAEASLHKVWDNPDDSIYDKL